MTSPHRETATFLTVGPTRTCGVALANSPLFYQTYNPIQFYSLTGGLLCLFAIK